MAAGTPEDGGAGDRAKLTGRIGTLPEAALARVEDGLRVALDLG